MRFHPRLNKYHCLLLSECLVTCIILTSDWSSASNWHSVSNTGLSEIHENILDLGCAGMSHWLNPLLMSIPKVAVATKAAAALQTCVQQWHYCRYVPLNTAKNAKWSVTVFWEWMSACNKVSKCSDARAAGDFFAVVLRQRSASQTINLHTLFAQMHGCTIGTIYIYISAGSSTTSSTSSATWSIWTSTP